MTREYLNTLKHLKDNFDYFNSKRYNRGMSERGLLKELLKTIKGIRSDFLKLHGVGSEEIMTITETAKFLKLSRKTIYKLIKEKKLKASRPQKKTIRIKKSEALDFLDRYTK